MTQGACSAFDRCLTWSARPTRLDIEGLVEQVHPLGRTRWLAKPQQQHRRRLRVQGASFSALPGAVFTILARV
jgi:hypothetical protein